MNFFKVFIEIELQYNIFSVLLKPHCAVDGPSSSYNYGTPTLHQLSPSPLNVFKILEMSSFEAIFQS